MMAGTVDQGMDGALHPLQAFLDHDIVARGAEDPHVHGAVNGDGGIERIFGNKYAFSQSKAIGLDHEGILRLLAIHVGLHAIRKFPGLRRGDAMTAHELLGKNLGGLQPCGRRLRTKNAQSGLLEGIHHPIGQGIIRSHDSQGDAFFFGKIDQGGNVMSGDWHIFAQGSRPGISGGAKDLFYTRRLAKFPSKGVFSASGANNEQFHTGRCATVMRADRKGGKTVIHQLTHPAPTSIFARVHSFSYRKGALHCEDVNLADVAEKTGTPVYVYSAETIRNNYRRLDAALKDLDRSVCFAVKANSNLAVLNLLAKEGAGFDIVSGGELYRVKLAGGKASSCTFAGVGKTREDIESALREGVHSFNVESEAELERINDVAGAMGLKAPVALRVNPDVDAKTHKYISTGKSKNKFGIGLDRAEEVYARAASLPHLHLRGVQTHIGSQILEAQPFAEAVAKLIPLVTLLRDTYNIEFFSVGGGMGIVYDPALDSGNPAWWSSNDHPHRITPEDYAAAIVPLLKPLGLRILFEPGRFLVGNAGVLLSTVQYVKTTPAKTFTVVDAAMNDLIRPALYEGYHEIVPLKEAKGADTAAMDVVGPVCESGDFFAQDRELPPLVEGDRIALMSSGAYGFVMSSNYNSRPLLPEVLVDGAQADVVRTRQSYADLVQGETIPKD